jgi:hypothetical protein
VVRPVPLNPGPLKLAELTLSVAEDWLVSVTDLESLAPMFTFPKLTAEGEAVN